MASLKMLVLVWLVAHGVTAEVNDPEAFVGARGLRSMTVKNVCEKSLCQDISDIRDGFSGIMDSVNSMSGDSAALKTDVNTHSDQIYQQMMEIMYLKQGIMNLTGMVTDLNHHRLDMQQDIQMLKQSLMQQKAENMYLRDDVMNLTDQLRNRNEENMYMKKRMHRLKDRLDKLEMMFYDLHPTTTTTTTTLPVEVKLYNISMSEFNNQGFQPVCFEIINSMFDANHESVLMLNGRRILEFIVTNDGTVICTAAPQQLVEGFPKNWFKFMTIDVRGARFELQGSFWAGYGSLTVYLFHHKGTEFMLPAYVTATLGDDPDAKVSMMTNGSSNSITFENVPASMMILVEAYTTNNPVYYSGEAAAIGPYTSIEMMGAATLSEVDNNDFSMDLNGWDTSNAGNGEVEIIPHYEFVGPNFPICDDFGSSGEFSGEEYDGDMPVRKRRVVMPMPDPNSGDSGSGDSGSMSGSDDGVLDLCDLVQEEEGSGSGEFPGYYEGYFEGPFGPFGPGPGLDRKRRSEQERDSDRSEELDRAIHDSLTATEDSSRKARSYDYNHDMLVSTVDEGPVSVTRAISVDPGVRSVAVRYRFVTSEVPGGYFGSEFNDYFSIKLRNQNTGKTVADTRSMNGLGLGAFDYYSGSTDWRQIEVEVTNSLDVIELTVLVANVADDLFDSHVIVDYMEEQSAYICMFSNVATDGDNGEMQGGDLEMMPGEGDMPMDGSGDGEKPSLGHAGVLVSSGDGSFTSYGLWPDMHPGIMAKGLDNGPGSDVRIDYGGDLMPSQHRYLTCSSIGDSGLKALADLVSHPSWKFDCYDNSATFAAKIYSRVTGNMVKSWDRRLDIDSPRKVGDSIRYLNDGQNWPPGLAPPGLGGGGAADMGIKSSFGPGYLERCFMMEK